MSRRTRRATRPSLAQWLAASGLLVALVPAFAPAAAAQEAGPRIHFVDVDTSDFPKVRAAVQTAADVPGPAQWELTEDGNPVAFEASSGSVGDVVVVLDASGSMASSGSLAAAQDSLASWVAELPAGQELGVVTYADEATVVVAPTADAAAVAAGVAGIQPGVGDALVAGVTEAVRLLEAEGGTLLLVTDGVGEGQVVDAAALQDLAATAAAADVAVEVVAVDGGGSLEPLAALGPLVDAAPVPPAEGVATGIVAVRTELATSVVLTWTSTSTRPSIDLVVSVGGDRDVRAAPTGIEPAAPEPARSASSGPSILHGTTGRLIVVGTVTAAVTTFAAALILIFSKRQDDIAGRLSLYTDEAARLAAADDSSGALTESSVMRRAVELTEGFAVRAGVLDKVGTKLDQAHLPFRPAEALLLYGVGIGFAAVFGGLLLGAIVGGLLGVVVGAVGPLLGLKFKQSKRIRKFNQQLPDTLTLLSSTLRAGYSLVQGVETVAQETEDPMARELQRVMVEHRLGRPLEEALDDMAARMGSKDFEWAVMAIRIQREVGGNLAELLQTVSETMVLRERMRREVKALTAEGTISAIVLGLLPVGLGGVMYMIAPDYIGKLFGETIGLVLLGVCGVSMAAGLAWMKKIITIES